MLKKLLVTVGTGLFLIGVAAIQVLLLLPSIGRLSGYQLMLENGDFVGFSAPVSAWIFPVFLVLAGAGTTVFAFKSTRVGKVDNERQIEPAR